MTDRIIILLDMDCFYVQVEERDNPQIKGSPAAVVQYNNWKGGGIIAVNYEARAHGINRSMRGQEAKDKCPSIQLITVPVQRGKADLTKYRNASDEVMSVLSEFSESIERASIDEAYIDLTNIVNETYLGMEPIKPCDLKATWVVWENEKLLLTNEDERSYKLSCWLKNICEDLEDIKDCERKLAIAATICEKMRQRILEITGFKCSAGISHNKMLSKLACGLHKPNQQTILPMDSVGSVWSTLPVAKIRNLGGKLGDSLVKDLKCKTMGDLSALSINTLKSFYDDKTAKWLFSLGKGIDSEPVVSRLLPKSIGCSKNFLGNQCLDTKEKLSVWLKNLAEELSERLEKDKEKNNRVAKTLTLNMSTSAEESSTLSKISKSCSLYSYNAESIAKIAIKLIESKISSLSKNDELCPAIIRMGFSAGKFQNVTSGNANIKDFLTKASTSKNISEKIPLEVKDENLDESSNDHLSTSPIISKRTTGSSFFLNFMAKANKNNNFIKILNSDYTNNSDSVKNLHLDSSKNFNSDSVKNLDSVINLNSDSAKNVNTNSEKNINDSCIKNVGTEYLTLSDDDEIESDLDQELDTKIFKQNILKSEPTSSVVSKKIVIIQNDSITCDDTSPNFEDTTSNCKETTYDCKVSSNLQPLTTDDSSDIRVNINELFPDLSNIDQSVVVLLPKQLQEEVERMVRSQKGSDYFFKKQNQTIDGQLDGTNNIKCKTCNATIPKSQYIEHSDYHFANDIRQKQMEDATSQSRNKKVPKSPKKRKRLKTKPKVNPKIPKIDSYFQKKK